MAQNLCMLTSCRSSSALPTTRSALCLVALCAATLMHAGCKSSGQVDAAMPSRDVPAVPTAGTVTGLVYLPGGGIVPRGAELTVKLVDATMSGASVAIAETTRRVETLPPFSFSLKPKAGLVKADRAYHVEAVIKYKKQTWTTTHYDAVLTGGAPSYVEVALYPSASR